jgi:hypothetical protein
MESRLLEILVCPLCKGSLHYNQQEQELICKANKLAFPVKDGVPVMLEGEARDLSQPSAADNVPADRTEAGADNSAA